ncbi:MAG: radical SAM protein [Deltaproteobacteria bacterium]|nr:radical SAM protein [Deltaproteobacteria bacterium]
MDLLKERGVIFGSSAMVTRENNELVVGDDFIDMLVEKSCFWMWYFAYMPVGRAPDINLMPTPEQRLYRFERIKELREKKDIVLADFWNDAPLVGGCIAGGRRYLHINNKGDVEPCIFMHFSVDNVREKSLLEILSSNFLSTIRERLPVSDNLLMPCMIIDYPKILRTIIAETGATPDYPEAKNILEGEIASFLDDYSDKLGVLCNPVWDQYCESIRMGKLTV